MVRKFESGSPRQTQPRCGTWAALASLAYGLGTCVLFRGVVGCCSISQIGRNQQKRRNMKTLKLDTHWGASVM